MAFNGFEIRLMHPQAVFGGRRSNRRKASASEELTKSTTPKGSAMTNGSCKSKRRLFVLSPPRVQSQRSLRKGTNKLNNSSNHSKKKQNPLRKSFSNLSTGSGSKLFQAGSGMLLKKNKDKLASQHDRTTTVLLEDEDVSLSQATTTNDNDEMPTISRGTPLRKNCFSSSSLSTLPTQLCSRSMSFNASSSMFFSQSSFRGPLHDEAAFRGSSRSLLIPTTSEVVKEKEEEDSRSAEAETAIMTKNPKQELGYLTVQFSSLEHAFKHGKQGGENGQPVLCLQVLERGDVEAGRQVFSHPLIVEAAQTLFTTLEPVKPPPASSCADEEEDTAADASQPADTSYDFVLADASGQTVVRIFDPHTGSELASSLSSKDGTLTRSRMVQAMTQALRAMGRSVPKYLQLVQEEEEAACSKAAATTTATSGSSRVRECSFVIDDNLADAEVELAGLDAVLSTKTFRHRDHNKKVIQVTYDSKRLSFCQLVRYALRQTESLSNSMVAIHVGMNDERKAALVEVNSVMQQQRKRHAAANRVVRVLGEPQPKSDDDDDDDMSVASLPADLNAKAALRKSPMRFVPLTDLQATRVNRLIHLGGRFDEAIHLLSPWQGKILMNAMQNTKQHKEQRNAKPCFDQSPVPMLEAWLSVTCSSC